jgi:tRNA dimethylallyltransferase
VRQLLADGVPASCTAMQAIGYKELAAALLAGRPISQGADEVKLRSRQYAKRQLTWFRRDPAIHWYLWDDAPDFSAALSFSTDLAAQAGLQ